MNFDHAFAAFAVAATAASSTRADAFHCLDGHIFAADAKRLVGAIENRLQQARLLNKCS